MALERASTQRSRSFRADMTVVMATVVSTAVANTRHYFGATIARGEHGEQALGLGCHRCGVGSHSRCHCSYLPPPPAGISCQPDPHMIGSPQLQYTRVEPGGCRAAPPRLTPPRRLPTPLPRPTRLALLRAPASSASQTNRSAWPASRYSTPLHQPAPPHYLNLRAVAS